MSWFKRQVFVKEGGNLPGMEKNDRLPVPVAPHTLALDPRMAGKQGEGEQACSVQTAVNRRLAATHGAAPGQGPAGGTAGPGVWLHTRWPWAPEGQGNIKQTGRPRWRCWRKKNKNPKQTEKMPQGNRNSEQIHSLCWVAAAPIPQWKEGPAPAPSPAGSREPLHPWRYSPSRGRGGRGRRGSWSGQWQFWAHNVYG